MKKSIFGAFLILCLSAISYAEERPLLLNKIDAAIPTNTEILNSKKLLAAKKPIKLLEKLSLAPFHKRAKMPIKPTENGYCNNCHLPLPHSKSIRTRAFMNMHSEYIACESCHFRPKKTPLFYRWYDYQHQKEADKQQSRLLSGRAQNDKTPIIPRTGRIKIVPFFQNKAVLITQEHPFSKQLQADWNKADLAEKSRLHAKIHQLLTTTGTQCAQCHTESQGLFDLSTFSDSSAQIKSIQKNTIADFFKHYKPEKPLKAGELPPIEQRIKMIDLLN
jgi:RNase P subunit RPR2